MNFFKKWFAKKCKEAWEDARNEKLSSPSVVVSETDSRLSSNGMHFTVYRANGGHIIEHRIYDRKTDRHNNSLHIITDEKDLGEELGKIITFENLRN